MFNFKTIAIILLTVKINLIKSEINLNTIKNYHSDSNYIQDINNRDIFNGSDSDDTTNDWSYHNLIENEVNLFKIIKFYLCNRYKTELVYSTIWNYTRNLNRPMEKSNDARGVGQKYRDMVSNSNVMITEIFDDLKVNNRSDGVTEVFLKTFQTELFQPTMIKKVDRYSKDRYTTLSSTYLWYDDNYNINVSNPFLKYNLINNNMTSIFNYKTLKQNFNNLIIVKNLDILKTFLRMYNPRYPFNGYTNHKHFMIFITDKIDMNDSTSAKILDKLIQRIWKNYGILNFICVINTNDTNYLYGVYMPFHEEMLWLSSDELFEKRLLLYDRLNDFHNFKLYFTNFERQPTMLRETKLPRNYVLYNQQYTAIKSLAQGYGGLDGMVMGNLAKALHFNPVIRSPSDGIEYGYNLDNGTFTGTIGDILYRRADISMNGRFIKYYETNELEFTFAVYFDQMCVIAPKALKIPQWLAIFLCFHPYVWLLIIFTNIFCGYFWYFLKQCAMKLERIISVKRKSDDLVHLLIEMWLILLSAPSNKMPLRLNERIFISTCLLANLIISGTFQGSLTTAFSTTSYYKDINTLEELDKSGLPIGTSSRGLADLFGENGGPLLTSLRSKYHILKEPAILRTAHKRDYCCVERLGDIKPLIHEYYANNDGTPMIHPIRQCPRTYHLAYIVKKGWPFLPRFNKKLQQFNEAGLLYKWYHDAEYARAIDRQYQNKYEDGKLQAFNMKDMQTAFFILSAGIFISTLVFIIETFIGRQYDGSRKGKSA